jgi:hypothetical protein
MLPVSKNCLFLIAPSVLIQAKVFCNGSEISKYSCLYDRNNHVYIESCNKPPDFVRLGKSYFEGFKEVEVTIESYGKIEISYIKFDIVILGDR